MVGLATSMLRPNWGRKSGGGTSSAVSAISFRSPPAQNARSPAPVSTSTLASSSALNRRTPANSPSRTARLSALRASGRSMVSQATPLRSSYRTTSGGASVPASVSSHLFLLVAFVFEDGQHGTAVDLGADRDGQFGDDPGGRGADRVLHLHGLDGQDHRARGHVVAQGDLDPDHGAGHRRQQRAGLGCGRRIGEPVHLGQHAVAQGAVDVEGAARGLHVDDAAHSGNLHVDRIPTGWRGSGAAGARGLGGGPWG